MKFRGDDRAVTVQIGAVLLFGILIISLATFQVAVVPDENSAIEFQHNLKAQQGMSDVRNALLSAASTGDPQSASIPLGTTYPQRTFLINPPPARGTVETADTGDTRVNVTINNANAQSEYDNAETYWNGTARTYDTGAVVYTPNYNEYSEAPTTVYEHSLVTNVFGENRTLEQTGQTLIRGNRINLLTINGTLQENGVGSQSVDARPLSAYTNTVTVTSTTSDPLWINITSRLDNETWEDEILLEQSTTNGGNVAEVVEISNDTRDGVTYHRVGIRLAPGNYELRGASVAVGTVSEANKQPKPTYLVVTDGYDEVGNGSTGNVTVQVRDQFNNPVDDFEVNGTLDTDYLQFVDDSGSEVNTLSVVTDEDGEATFTYKAVNETTGSQTAWLNMSILGGGAEYRYKNFTGKQVPVIGVGDDGTGGDTGNTFNPGEIGSVILDDATEDEKADIYTLTLNNTDAENRTIQYARINVFILQVQGGGGGGTKPSFADFYTPSDTQAARLSVGDGYKPLSPDVTINAGSTADIELRFDTTPSNDDSWFVITLVYENGEQSLYFVSVPS